MAKVLRDINVYAGDNTFFGKCSEVEVPSIEWAVEEFRNSGLAMKTEEILGLEKMELSMTFRDPCPEMVGYVGNPDADDEPITIRGAVTQRGTTDKIEIKANGLWKTLESSNFTSGGAQYTQKFVVTLDFFSYHVNGKELYFVEDATGIIRAGGKDLTKSIRDALGI